MVNKGGDHHNRLVCTESYKSRQQEWKKLNIITVLHVGSSWVELSEEVSFHFTVWDLRVNQPFESHLSVTDTSAHVIT